MQRLRHLQLATLTALLVAALLVLFQYQTLNQQLQVLHNETYPIIDALRQVRIAALRTVSSVSEYAFLSQLGHTESEPSEAREVELSASGKALFTNQLTRYRQLVVHHSGEQHPGAERVFFEGNLLHNYADQFIKNVQSGTITNELFELKELLEQSETRFLALSEQLITNHEQDLANQLQQITKQRNGILFTLVLAVLLLSSLLVYQYRMTPRTR